MVGGRFYWLSSGWVRGALEGGPSASEFEGPSVCDAWERALRGEPAGARLQVALHRGGRPYPFLWAGTYPLVDERVVALFTSNGLTGFTTSPVEVLRSDGTPVDGYRVLGVTGRCDRITIGEGYSRVVERTFPGGTFPHYQGLYVDVATWDGSDFLMSRERGVTFVVVTARVREALLQSRVKNVDLRDTEEIEFPVLPSRPADPPPEGSST